MVAQNVRWLSQIVAVVTLALASSLALAQDQAAAPRSAPAVNIAATGGDVRAAGAVVVVSGNADSVQAVGATVSVSGTIAGEVMVADAGCGAMIGA